MKDCQTIIFDFDGVLSCDKFYEPELIEQFPEVYKWIQTNIFGSNNRLVTDWMRGKLASEDIHKVMAMNIDINHEVLNEILEQSVVEMRIDIRVKNLAWRLKQEGYKLSLVTDNMDVFSRITVKNHKLNELFDVIVNSADYGYLKNDFGGKLFDIALAKIGSTIEKSLLIDDSLKTIELYKQKGGDGFLYTNFQELELFLYSGQ